MFCWLLATTALAQVAPTYPRLDAPLSARSASSIRGDGPARLVGRRGPIQAWTFPDGHIEHYLRTAEGERTELVRYDAHLAHHLTVTYANGTPLVVEVHATPNQTVDVGAWVPVELGEARLRLPEATDGPAVDLPMGSGRLRVRWTELADIRDPSLPATLEGLVGGRVLAAETAWLDGAPGVRFTMDLPDPLTPRIAEAWAIPRPNGLLVATWTTPTGEIPLSLDTLATGRAAMALLTWQSSR